MNAEVITIGTELLLGQIIDTNAVYISKKLAEIGISVYYRTTVGDNKERIVNALKIACERADVIILTGGLGPTVDDITRLSIAEFTGTKLFIDNDTLLKIDEFFKKKDMNMPESNKVQAYIPEGALLVENKNGTAPGFILNHNSKIIAAMPGVSSEMHTMMEQAVMPYIVEKNGNTSSVIKYKTLKIVGMPESIINDKIEDIFKSSINPSIAILAHNMEVDLRITVKADNTEKADEMIKSVNNDIKARLGDNIYGEDDDSLEYMTGVILKAKNMTISTVESCTAGLFSYRLTSVPGSSFYFKGGINSYSNESKINILGVESDIINEKGAVSKECAEDMARKCREKFKSNVSVSITGIAGPGGGNAEKPVGLVFIGVNMNGVINVYKHIFAGGREAVRVRSVQAALFYLYKILKSA